MIYAEEMKTFQMFCYHYVQIYWHQHVFFTKLRGITQHTMAVKWVYNLFWLKIVAGQWWYRQSSENGVRNWCHPPPTGTAVMCFFKYNLFPQKVPSHVFTYMNKIWQKNKHKIIKPTFITCFLWCVYLSASRRAM